MPEQTTFDSEVPVLTEFSPDLIPFQIQVIRDIRTSYDYSLGVHEVLLSGSVGSAKTLLMAHLAVTHAIDNQGANILIGRAAMPYLKDTLLRMITDHIGNCIDYEHNLSRGIITFPNKSRIFCYSWSDKKYRKVRSYALSAAFIEELTENEDPEFYKEIRMRLNRMRHIKEKILVCATNPDAPSHWAYEYFIANQSKTRHVYYSVTSDNPFLDPTYIERLKETLSPKEALRMLYGKWIELSTDIIYYNYNHERNFKDEQYKINFMYPIDVMFDFNIGVGKPLSCAIGQFINGTYHVFDEIIIEGVKTINILDELQGKEYFQKICHIRIFGDSTGKSRDTRSIKTDYEIIEHFLARQFTGSYQIMVPLANPPIRKRHNLVNSTFLNDNNKVRFYCYLSTPTVDRGFRLTKLVKSGKYTEDDKDSFQHVTTAIGYWICEIEEQLSTNNRVTVRKIV